VAAAVGTVTDEEVWSEQSTTPTKIEAALRRLLAERHHQAGSVAPARVLNLVVVVDRRYRGEIENRLQGVGRYHPSRTILCAVEDRRTTLDAWASMATQPAGPAGLAVSRERVEIDMGPDHLRSLETIVGPLVVPDLATLVWAPHGHHEAEDALRDLAQIVLIDSLAEPDVDIALHRASGLLRDLYVVDLAWLRSTPWRERVAAAFDPPQHRPELQAITAVTVRHRQDSEAAASLFAGWLASRLGWRPSPMLRRGDALVGRMRARRGDVQVTLEPVEQLNVPGLAGVTVETARGTKVSLDRSPGGLREVRTDRKGDCREFTVLGASRGEGGVLGEGVRQALLRDSTYAPALEAAHEMVHR
jgi:glucose-6-phosphate dehydrogenase assembly protein OpcA